MSFCTRWTLEACSRCATGSSHATESFLRPRRPWRRWSKAEHARARFRFEAWLLHKPLAKALAKNRWDEACAWRAASRSIGRRASRHETYGSALPPLPGQRFSATLCNSLDEKRQRRLSRHLSELQSGACRDHRRSPAVDCVDDLGV